MNNPFCRFIFGALCMSFLCMHSINAQTCSVDWNNFLEKQDPTYDRLSTKWEEGVFTGNGLLGTMLYMENKDTLRLDIGRTDVYDHSKQPIDKLFGKARLPIGHFRIIPKGKILSIESRLDLWNAEVRSSITTDEGTINLRILTAATRELILVESRTEGKETDFGWEWKPARSISPRAESRPLPEGYEANPEPIISNQNELQYCQQSLRAGGAYTTIWKTEGKAQRNFYITVHYSQTDKDFQTACTQMKATNRSSAEQIIREHRDRWHSFYPQSFFSSPDARLESFYWIQQYKLASATRKGKPAIDLQGPWTRFTPWPAYWMNLNIQLTYSPLYTANRLDLASTLVDFINKNKENLQLNVPEPYRYNSIAIGRTTAPDLLSPVLVTKEETGTLADADAETGNLTWVLYCYWQHYRYSMDKQVLSDLFPLLKGSINYYIHLMDKNDAGKWIIAPKTYSPEYPGGMGRNTNYDLSLLRWGVNTLSLINEQEGYNDPLAATWKDISENLIDYPQDSTGLMIAEGIPYSTSHRHYSHLLMIYPLYEMNWDQEENRELIERSLNHWQSMPAALQGYSFTGRASINAMMGRGNEARDALKTLLNRFVKPNTMYLETGPVIETPLAAAASIQELYLQYWNNTARVFPAVPDDWRDASFENFRTEGAFLISALRKDGITQWVRIKSEKGGSLRIKPGLGETIHTEQTAGKQASIHDEGKGIYTCILSEGAEIVLYSNNNALEYSLGAVAHTTEARNSFGLKK